MSNTVCTYSHQINISSNQLFSNFFNKNVDLTEKMLILNVKIVIAFYGTVFDIFEYHSVEKCYKMRSWFLRKNQHFFRQINTFTKEVTKELISRKIFERDRVF